MIILGISDSHEAHACIVQDGRLLAAIAEERLSRLKADMGYPERSIDKILRTVDISPQDIDIVAVTSVNGTAFQRLYLRHGQCRIFLSVKIRKMDFSATVQ
jgi:carbamoyltransferase